MAQLLNITQFPAIPGNVKPLGLRPLINVPFLWSFRLAGKEGLKEMCPLL